MKNKKTVSELLTEKKFESLLESIPNTMGINLSAVDSLEWEEQEDGQLTNVPINFAAEYYTTSQMKIWHTHQPKADTSYICRMDSGYIKMCHWTGSEWLDMWSSTLDGRVKEWMEIPYDPKHAPNTAS